MKNQVKLYIIILLLLGGMTQLAAQVRLSNGILVENPSVTKNGQKVSVDIDFRLDDLQLGRSGRVVLTPMLVKGADTLLLPPMEIARRSQKIYQERNSKKDDSPRVIVQHKNNAEQTAAYHHAFPYEKWMGGAAVAVHHDDCGCNDLLGSGGNDLARFNVEPPAYRPSLAYVAPEVTKKTLTAEGSAHLIFPVSKTHIDPSLGNNASELEKIYRACMEVKNTPKATIDHITLHGYASPEGSYALNTRLARQRVEALKEYVIKMFKFPESDLSVKSTPENWEGVRKFVAESSSLTDKQAILDLIDSNREPDAKELAIKTAYPADYAYLLRECYPDLRRTDYSIGYSVGDYTVEEAKALLKTNPALLNLNEMYLVAQTYPAGSDEFNEVFEIAVRLFPDDTLANLNAANIALSKGDTKRAASFLSKAGESGEAVNARGVRAMLDGELDEALALLGEAEQKGIPHAKENMDQVENRIENY